MKVDLNTHEHVYCDECGVIVRVDGPGESIEVEEHVVHDELPYDTNEASRCEPGVVCVVCDVVLRGEDGRNRG